MLRQRLLASLDLPTLLVAAALVAIGLLGIASATAGEGGRMAGLWQTQLVWFGLGTAVALLVVAVDYHYWSEFAMVFHGLVLLLLVIVLFAGKEVGGNRSWLELGPFNIQPSEFAKWTTCLVLAAYLTERVRGRLGLRGISEMGILAGAPTVLVASQPDMGTAITFVPIYVAAIVLGGLRWRVVVVVVAIGVLLLPVGWGQLKDYQKERILTVFDPARDPSGIGYQVRQSKIAIGSGGLHGAGLFRGSQSNLNFLPAQHTDFILAVLAEELGFVGAVLVLGLFYTLLYRGIMAARSSQDRLGTYLCLLIVAWITGQIAVNVGMVLGFLPTIGVPLPLLSYGGSSLLAVSAGIALIVNVRSRRFVN